MMNSTKIWPRAGMRRKDRACVCRCRILSSPALSLSLPETYSQAGSVAQQLLLTGEAGGAVLFHFFWSDVISVWIWKVKMRQKSATRITAPVNYRKCTANDTVRFRSDVSCVYTVMLTDSGLYYRHLLRCVCACVWTHECVFLYNGILNIHIFIPRTPPPPSITIHGILPGLNLRIPHSFKWPYAILLEWINYTLVHVGSTIYY